MTGTAWHRNLDNDTRGRDYASGIEFGKLKKLKGEETFAMAHINGRPLYWQETGISLRHIRRSLGTGW